MNEREKSLLTILRGARIAQGMREVAHQGYLPNRIPMGYKTVHLSLNHWKIVPHTATALHISDLFLEAAKGTASLKALSEYAYAKGLTSKRGKPLAVSTLHGILTNPFYCGVILYEGNRINGNHLPLVSPHLFEAVQVILKRRRRG